MPLVQTCPEFYMIFKVHAQLGHLFWIDHLYLSGMWFGVPTRTNNTCSKEIGQDVEDMIIVNGQHN